MLVYYIHGLLFSLVDCFRLLFLFSLSAIKLGEFAEVFKGLYDGSTVAVKILKVRYNESFVGGY